MNARDVFPSWVRRFWTLGLPWALAWMTAIDAAPAADRQMTVNELHKYSARKTNTYVACRFNRFPRWRTTSTIVEAGPFSTLTKSSPPVPGGFSATVKAGQVFTNSIGMKLIAIPAGVFVMGAAIEDDKTQEDEQPAHRVKISKPFYLGIQEVTQKEYLSVMGEAPWKGHIYAKEGNQIAASFVSWDHAVAFCRKLSEREGKTYRLPTEAEWEFACRAGSTTHYSFGDEETKLGEFAWLNKNAWDVGEKYAHTVGQKKPNGFGLYDMHGNVFEWCQDVYDEQAFEKRRDLAVDPLVTSGSEYRVLRGGSWHDVPRCCRSSVRYFGTADGRALGGVGLRVVCELR